MRAYDPYGVMTSTVGTSQAAYGYTGEYTGDYNELLYLRARHYAPGMGRFLTRDTWQGNSNNPMSFNRWMYGYGNPTNYTDPSGHFPYGPWCLDNFTSRANAAEDYVDRTIDGHLIKDYLNTYTAAGIGVQCYSANLNRDYFDSGWGPAQISLNRRDTAYGEVLENGRGVGIRCWISIQYKYTVLRGGVIFGDVPSSCFCLTDDEMKAMDKDYKQHYQLEPPHNPSEATWAVEYMRRTIKLVTDKCLSKGCSATDIYIAAALSQNGPGFTQVNIEDLTRRKSQRVNIGGATIDWWAYFGLPGNADDTQRHLILFDGVIKELQKRNWYIPDGVNWSTIEDLKRIGD